MDAKDDNWLRKPVTLPSDTELLGAFASVKLSGKRAFWDGGISRGVSCGRVPWASSFCSGISTGLWDENRWPIIAPDWFLNYLPSSVMDGVLVERPTAYAGPAGPDWVRTDFHVFGSPPLKSIFRDSSEISYSACYEFVMSRIHEHYRTAVGDWRDEMCSLAEWLSDDNLKVTLHRQTLLKGPSNEDAWAMLYAMLDREVDERRSRSLIVRLPNAVYEFSPFEEVEGVISGYVNGSGANTGRIGSLAVTLADGIAMVSRGLLYTEREYAPECRGQAANEPGGTLRSGDGLLLPKGLWVRLLYRAGTYWFWGIA